MTEMRRLILHAGAPKTGTSAIQQFLASNIESLKAIGLDYLHAEPVSANLHTTGNGLPIFLYFERAESDLEALADLIEAYFGSERAALLSCELLSSLSQDAWRAIVETCGAKKIAPSIIYYVRNIYPFYVSGYNQLVKHNGLKDSFDAFVAGNKIFHCAERLNFFAELVGTGHLTVAHYESARADICAHFLSLIRPGADAAAFSFHHACVNRSLDESELRLMRIANRYPKAHFPGELPNLLISSDPDRRPAKPSRPEVVALLTERHLESVEEINARYFGGRPVLQIDGAGPTMAEDAGLAPAPAERLFEWAMARLESSRPENIRQFLNEARALADCSRKIFHPLIPPDFDAAGYLLCNPDLLMVRVNPYRHFLEHGRKEERSWRVDGAATAAATSRSGVLQALLLQLGRFRRLAH